MAPRRQFARPIRAAATAKTCQREKLARMAKLARLAWLAKLLKLAPQLSALTVIWGFASPRPPVLRGRHRADLRSEPRRQRHLRVSLPQPPQANLAMGAVEPVEQEVLASAARRARWSSSHPCRRQSHDERTPMKC